MDKKYIDIFQIERSGVKMFAYAPAYKVNCGDVVRCEDGCVYDVTFACNYVPEEILDMILSTCGMEAARITERYVNPGVL